MQAWCCKAISVGKWTGCFCPLIASSKLCCFPCGTIEQVGLGAQNIKEKKLTIGMWEYNKCICLDLQGGLLMW